MLRDSIKAAQISSMKSGDKPRLAAVRLILAKLKDKDIELRTASQLPDDDAIVVDVLQKMAKQRRESIEMYRKGGREELAAGEEAEVAVIERFLPQQMDEAATKDAVAKAIAAVGATSIKDMGKVMGVVKKAYTGQMDFASAGVVVKGLLS